MPWVIVNMLKGRTGEQKHKLHQSVAKAVAESIDVPLDRIHVQLVEMERADYSTAGVPSDKK